MCQIQLPMDVILLILQCVDDQQTMYQCSLTCQTISPYALRLLWSMPYITSVTSLVQLTRTLSSHHSLYSYKKWIFGLAIHLDCKEDQHFPITPDHLFYHLTHLDLEILSLEHIHIENNDAVAFANFVRRQLDQGVAELHVSQSSVLKYILEAIQYLPRFYLYSLSIDQCPINDQMIQEAIAYCPALRTLKLHRSGCLSDLAMMAIAKSCAQLDTLSVTLPANIIQSNTITIRTLDALETHCQLLKSFVCGGQSRITEYVSKNQKTYSFAVALV